jgi:hypothetical protein
MNMRDLLNIVSEDESNSNDETLAAIGQLIADRSADADTESRLSTNAFIHIANKMGLSLTPETLMDLAQSGDLKNIIKDVNAEEIVFHGKRNIDANANMTVDKARETVKKMAKRQLDI